MRRKTNAEFVAEVKALVGDEYIFLEEYKTSRIKILVVHKKCGYEYSVTPSHFLGGSGCPKCAGVAKKTDDEFRTEVKSLVGDEYTVLGRYKNKKTKVRFIHNSCGYEFSAAPNNFLSGTRCANCFGTPKKTDEEFKAESKELAGDEYEFLGEYKNSKTDIRVIHNKCGYEYSVTPNRFLRGSGCPKCAGVAKKTDDEFRTEVKSLVGDEYTVLGRYEGRRCKILFSHNKCGHEYFAAPFSFLRGSRCPKCSESKGERAVAAFLDAEGIPYTDEYPIKYAKNRRPLRIDFLAAGVAIEYDGQQHFEAVKGWGGELTLREVQRRDRIKNEYCAANGIPMIRIPYWDFERIDEILTEKLLPLIRNKVDKLA